MARDYTLLRKAREGVLSLRLYSWRPACLSFGRNEPALARYDRSQLESDRVDVVRRPTGGRAVWHEHEVTYAVAAPDSTFGTMRETYILIHEMLSAALQRLGAHTTVSLDGSRTNLDDGPCFASPVGGEVVCDRGKLVGSAQVREEGCFLQHGSILVKNGQGVVERYTTRSVAAQQAVGLEDLLGRSTSFHEVTAAITAEVSQAWEFDWSADHCCDWPDSDIDFADPVWTWRR